MPTPHYSEVGFRTVLISAEGFDRERSDTENNTTLLCTRVEDPRLCSTHGSLEGRARESAEKLLRREPVTTEAPSFGNVQYCFVLSRHEDANFGFL